MFVPLGSRENGNFGDKKKLEGSRFSFTVITFSKDQKKERGLDLYEIG